MGVGVDNAIIQASNLMATLHSDVADLVNKGPCAVYQESINLSAAEFCEVPPAAPAFVTVKSAPHPKVVPTRDGSPMDFDTTPSPHEAALFEAALSDLIVDASPSRGFATQQA